MFSDPESSLKLMSIIFISDHYTALSRAATMDVLSLGKEILIVILLLSMVLGASSDVLGEIACGMTNPLAGKTNSKNM